ncbi:MAG: hypothetical protein IJO72_00435 [Oscillospiraceae bacterium]|nr:hypothetical protein [Oscillospiraceae bacterium]
MKFDIKKTFSQKMLKTVAIYAAIFLVIAIVGLIILWNYMDAYEKSQPKNVIDSYIFNLDDAHIKRLSADYMQAVNHDVQSDDDCLAIFRASISSGVTYARNMSECTEDKMVYMLMCDGNTMGKVVLTANGTGAFGLSQWQVSEESLDFSYLLNEGETLEVPDTYKVYANGRLLGRNSIVQRDTPITVLKDFYADYDTLPYMMTYQVGPYFGDVEITITDAEGNSVTPEQASDPAFILDNCSNSEKDTLDNLVSGFIDSYVRFTTNADEKLDENYADVLTYIVPESDLAQRMADALNGLKWNKNQDAEVLSKTAHYRTRLAGGLYLYDVSYEVQVTHQGVTTTTVENVRFLLSQTVDGLKVERMLNY